MGKSYKKNLYYGNAGESDKKSKQQANQNNRSRVKNIINKAVQNDDEVLMDLAGSLDIRDHSNVWDFQKDGKCNFYDATDEEKKKWSRK